jgi:hypothetical protein
MVVGVLRFESFAALTAGEDSGEDGGAGAAVGFEQVEVGHG